MKLRILDDNGEVWLWDLDEGWLKLEGDDTESGGEPVGGLADVLEFLIGGLYIEG